MKQLFVFLFLLVNTFPLYADTPAMDEPQDVETQMVEDSGDLATVDTLYAEEEDQVVSANDKLIFRCQVHARNRLGRIIGRFFSFKPRLNARCFRGMRMCHNWFQRTHRFGFCRDTRFNRFPRNDDRAME